MIALGTLGAFALTSVIIESTPGPNMGYLAILSASEGRKAGFAATAGVALGLLLVGMAAALGLAVAIENSPLIYQTLRWGGVAYLIWLAYVSWKEATETPAEENITRQKAIEYFRRGLFTNLLNPKAAIFFIAILPTFTDINLPIMPQTIIFTVVFVSIATSIHATIVTLSGYMQVFLKDPKKSIIARRFFSILLLGIAIWFGWNTA